MSVQEARQALMGEAVAPYHVLRYDLWYDLDPADRRFASSQWITLSNDTAEPQPSVSFLLHADLCVDEARLCDAQQGGTLPSAMQIRPAAYRGRDYHLVTLILDEPLPTHAVVELELSCHLEPQHITRGRAEGIDRLVIDTAACYAVNASLGHFPLLALGDAATLAAPYTLTLTYPEGWLSCVPGSLISANTVGSRCQDTYDCPKPNLPAFSCAPYERTVIERQGLSLELLHYREQEHLRTLVDHCFALIALYTDRLGGNGLRGFQLATVGSHHERRPWIECHGNVLYLNGVGLDAVADDSRVLEETLAHLAHELFHSWNLFHAPVDGPMSMWISEGLANWAAAWALEQVLGPEAGARCRLRYLQAFVRDRGFEAQSGLGYLADGCCHRPPEWQLIYSGGALVWEQVCQNLGERDFVGGLRRFFHDRAGQMSSAADLFDALQQRHPHEIGPYLEPWLEVPPDLALSIAAVERVEEGAQCLARICLDVDSPIDLEIHSEIGWRTTSGGKLETLPLVFDQRGLRCLTITSAAPLQEITLDPYHRLPLRRLEGLDWHH